MANKNRSNLGYNLVSYRKRALLTQDEVAAAVGVKRSTYAYYESDTNPPLPILRRLAALYKISMEELVGEEAGEVLPTAATSGNYSGIFTTRFNELSDEEKALILRFRSMDEEERNQLKEVLER